MKLFIKYMARCILKEIQLTSLDVNQISIKIYDSTWKSSLGKYDSFVVLIAPKALGFCTAEEAV